ncbi:glycosyltransferase [Siccirubricoccus phaeus]|uniref:glycosyltransferase n=1 Tax=Siccirubricoccus phaeus TaxID=2595053 RepID=UPI0011F0B188|nr:glycosyltransferase [Siccirubricoccus phaeus]
MQAEVAVIIPAYRQPALLAEAMLSVLTQEGAPETALVVVDDGCPFAATRRTVAELAALHPGRVHLLRQRNQGLSAARNAGIEFALAAFPDCRALYFLDADNRLLPRFLGRAMAALAAAAPEVGWIYPDIDEFGGRENWGLPGEFSLLQLLLTNYCEAGSLVRQALFAAGLRFDTAMRQGFEDWDFWLAAAARGWRGQHLPASGFLYRRRPESMLAASERIRPLLLGELYRKHAPLLAPRRLLALEAAEAPRHAIHLLDAGVVRWTLDPAEKGEELPPATARRRLAAALEAQGARFAPPIAAFLDSATLALLARFGVLHLVFWWAGRLLEKTEHVALDILPTDRPEMALERAGTALLAPDRAAALFLRAAALARPVPELPPGTAPEVERSEAALLRLRLPLEGAEVPASRAPWQAAALEQSAMAALRHARRPGSGEWKREYRPPRAGMAAAAAALAGLGPALPLAPGGGRRIGFLLPLFSFAGLEKVVLNQAMVLRARGWRCILFVLGAGRVERGPDFAAAFDSVVPLDGLGETAVEWQGGYFGAGFSRFDREAASPEVLGLLAGMDVVVNVHSLAGQALMASLRRLGTRTYGGLHLVERGPWGEPQGTPHIQLAYEHAYDGVLVISEQLRDWCRAAGIPGEKLHLIRNAPGHRTPPARVAAALRARRLRPAGPLRVLYLGRLDAQKGIDRLAAMIARTQGAEQREEIAWRVVGRAVLGEAELPLPVPVEPPALSAEALDALYAEADVLLLPSRYEGVPLVVLEAQRMGCVPVATDVGAVAEAIADGVDGVLIRHDAPEEVVVADGLAALRGLAADRARLRTMAEAAAARIAALGWEEAMAEFLGHLEAVCPRERPGERRGERPGESPAPPPTSHPADHPGAVPLGAWPPAAGAAP